MARDGRRESDSGLIVDRPRAVPGPGRTQGGRTQGDIEHTQPMEHHGESVDAPLEIEDTSFITSALPRVEQLPPRIEPPPGIIVEEKEMGRATGQWIVQIRCDCGRRWFDVQMVKTARCPRCDALVVVTEID